MTPTEWKRLPRAEKNRLRALKHERRRSKAKQVVIHIARPHPSGCLAGTELKRLLAAFGFKPTKKCGCNRHARKMDEAGCDCCEENIETIVGWMKFEATKRKLPFSNIAARRIIKTAITRAKRKASHV